MNGNVTAAVAVQCEVTVNVAAATAFDLFTAEYGQVVAGDAPYREGAIRKCRVGAACGWALV